MPPAPLWAKRILRKFAGRDTNTSPGKTMGQYQKGKRRIPVPQQGKKHLRQAILSCLLMSQMSLTVVCCSAPAPQLRGTALPAQRRPRESCSVSSCPPAASLALFCTDLTVQSISDASRPPFLGCQQQFCQGRTAVLLLFLAIPGPVLSPNLGWEAAAVTRLSLSVFISFSRHPGEQTHFPKGISHSC